MGYECTCTNCGQRIKPEQLVMDLEPIYQLPSNNTRRSTMTDMKRYYADEGCNERIKKINKVVDDLPLGSFKRRISQICNLTNFQYSYEDYRNETFMMFGYIADKSRCFRWKDTHFEELKRKAKEIVAEYKSTDRGLGGGMGEKKTQKQSQMRRGQIEILKEKIKQGIDMQAVENTIDVIVDQNLKAIDEQNHMDTQNADIVRAIVSAFETGITAGRPNIENPVVAAAAILRYAYVKLVEEKLRELDAIDKTSDNAGEYLHYFEEKINEPVFHVLNNILNTEHVEYDGAVIDFFQEVDELMYYFLPIDLDLFNERISVEQPQDGIWTIAYSDEQPIEDRHCPCCYSRVAKFAGAYREITIALSGNPRVSKSTTIAANLDFIIRNSGWMYETDDAQFYNSEKDLGAKGDSRWAYFNKNYLEPYSDGWRVEATVTDNKTNIPKFSILFKMPGAEPLMITFLDVPGEYIKNPDLHDKIVKEYAPLYKNIDYVWVCTDILEWYNAEVGKIAQSAGYDKGNRPSNTNEIVREWQKKYSPIKIMANSGKESKAILIIGKSDMSESINPDDNDYFSLFKPEMNITLNKDHIDQQVQVSILEHEITDKMIQWRNFVNEKSASLCNEFEQLFDRRMAYCAMSAYGYAPTDKGDSDQGTNPDFNPYMSGWPLVWVLVMEGYIKLEYDVTRTSGWGFFKKTTTESVFGDVFSDENCRRNMVLEKTGEDVVYYEHYEE